MRGLSSGRPGQKSEGVGDVGGTSGPEVEDRIPLPFFLTNQKFPKALSLSGRDGRKAAISRTDKLCAAHISQHKSKRQATTISRKNRTDKPSPRFLKNSHKQSAFLE
jgi:hypothetical protein